MLIVAPGHLKYQWQREMKSRFGTHFTLVNRSLMESNWGQNIWEAHNCCAASTDFLKQDDIIQKLRASSWDLVVVDEVHKMSAYRYATKDGTKVERTKRLEELLKLPDKISQDKAYENLQQITAEDLEDMEEADRWKIEEKLMHLTLAQNLDEVKAEIEKIEDLIGFAETVKGREIESKLVKLRDDILPNIGDRKLLIFTEFTDTLDYLVQKLTSWGYSMNTLHGSMNMDTRIEAEHRFKDETQIMVATEAAGEGINLQFCSCMVNYDIPWNPNRLEQRMRRIHRYDQDKEVFIYNMVGKDTREGQILDRLFDKLDRMREALGSDRVFDVIGAVIPGSTLEEIIRDAITGQRRMEEIYDLVDEINPAELKHKMEQIFMTSLATRHIDYSEISKNVQEADENRLMPEYIADYFLRAFTRFGGEYKEDGATYKIKSIPFELRKLNEDYNFKSRYGAVERTYPRITFDKDAAKAHSSYEYVAPGHPLLEAVNQKAIDSLGNAGAVAVFADETNSKEGVFWFIECELADGLGATAGKRIFCVYPDDVHQENHGFDIRSIEYGEDGDFEDIRYIEVKVRAQEGAIRISANEWKKDWLHYTKR